MLDSGTGRDRSTGLGSRNDLASLLSRGGQVLFFAALPDAATQALVGQVTDAFRHDASAGATLIPADRLHVTLQPVGLDVGDARVMAERAGTALAHPPFPVSMGEVMCFAGRSRPMVLVDEEGTSGFRQLQTALAAEMARAGFRRIKKDREPHMTLGYFRQPMKGFAVGPIRWTVREFALIRSNQGEGRYDILGRWALKG